MKVFQSKKTKYKENSKVLYNTEPTEIEKKIGIFILLAEISKEERKVLHINKYYPNENWCYNLEFKKKVST